MVSLFILLGPLNLNSGHYKLLILRWPPLATSVILSCTIYFMNNLLSDCIGYFIDVSSSDLGQSCTTSTGHPHSRVPSISSAHLPFLLRQAHCLLDICLWYHSVFFIKLQLDRCSPSTFFEKFSVQISIPYWSKVYTGVCNNNHVKEISNNHFEFVSGSMQYVWLYGFEL